MTDQKPGMFARFRTFLSRRSPLVLLVGGVAAGITLWGGFNWSMELTNTETFCISCHEMRDTVYEEYKETVHYQNASGVQASCPDCHVPRPWINKVVRKIYATRELYHKIMGTIDTPEKFEAHRWEMANRVWDSMVATDSRECRNCHHLTAMDLDEQDKSAKKKHAKAQEDGKTCIECHKGIAHEYPKKPGGEAAAGQ